MERQEIAYLKGEGMKVFSLLCILLILTGSLVYSTEAARTLSEAKSCTYTLSPSLSLSHNLIIHQNSLHMLNLICCNFFDTINYDITAIEDKKAYISYPAVSSPRSAPPKGKPCSSYYRCPPPPWLTLVKMNMKLKYN